ncbi:MAG: helix-turn-helix domain-containing protein [Firmicutes bacterium]|nr:helix-turn-helix domain-containing protein [Bacillota bacterium]
MNKYTGLFNIRAERITYKPFHISENLQLLYVLKGSLHFRIVAGIHKLQEGDIEILNINEPVSFEKTDEDNLILIFEIDKGKAKEYCDYIDTALFNCNTKLFFSSSTDWKNLENLKEKMRTLYHYYISDISDILLEKMVKEIVVFIGNHCHDLRNMFQENGSDVRSERFYRIFTYMFTHYYEKINLKEIAEREYMSQQYLSKEFNDRLHMNFKDTLEYYRVINAVRYLITTKMTITMISEHCGFSASRYFYKHFSLYLQCSPREFRNKYLSRKEECQEIIVSDPYIKERLLLLEKQTAQSLESSKTNRTVQSRTGIFQHINYSGIYSKKRVCKEVVKELLEQTQPLLCQGIFIAEAWSRAKREQLEALAELNGSQNIAPCAFVFYTSRPAGDTDQRELILKVEEAAIAAYHMGLYAKEKGLVFSIANDILHNSEEIRQVLNLSKTDFPILLITVGYAA